MHGLENLGGNHPGVAIQRSPRHQSCGRFDHVSPFAVRRLRVPSGKRLHDYEKAPLLMCKSTNSMAMFTRKRLVCQRVKPLKRGILQAVVVGWVMKW